MDRAAKARRVALAAIGPSDNAFGSFRGVLDYKERVAHWRLVGQITKPIMAFEDLDLDQVDGVIGFFRESHWAKDFADKGVVAVNFSNAIEDLPIPRVGNDEQAIGRLGAEHLLERGFAHFAFLPSGDTWYSRLRLAAFKQAIEQRAGQACQVYHPPGGKRAVGALGEWFMDLPKPLALMAANDLRGCEAIQLATSLGISVPDEIAVLGVDNDHWLTQLPAVPMSSIEPDWRRIGYRAAEMLDGLMNGETHDRPLWVPPLGVVSRQSTDVVVSEDPVVAQALRYIQEHVSLGIGVDDVLDDLGVSRRSLESRMKRAIGQTPYAAIVRARIDRAKAMLVRTDAPMSEIARECGVEQYHFYTLFKKATGMTPGAYRQRFSNYAG